jgi:hypothetical protein
MPFRSAQTVRLGVGHDHRAVLDTPPVASRIALFFVEPPLWTGDYLVGRDLPLSKVDTSLARSFGSSSPWTDLPTQLNPRGECRPHNLLGGRKGTRYGLQR